MFDAALDPHTAHEVSTEAAGWLATARASRHPRLALSVAWSLVPLAWLACASVLLEAGPFVDVARCRAGA